MRDVDSGRGTVVPPLQGTLLAVPLSTHEPPLADMIGCSESNSETLLLFWV
jgi:hypothetical protein